MSRRFLLSAGFLFLLIFAGAFFSVVHGDENIIRLMESCRVQKKLTRSYDPAYVRLDYPMGDIEITKGVCTDVVIRAFRAAGIDLQKEIHEDMKANFSQYPDNWRLKKPDRNIDHRRVPNIATYLKRKGKALAISKSGGDYKPGDVVIWKIPGNLNHIGIVSDVPVPGAGRNKIYHNIGTGVVLNDILFDYQITGHFRFF